ncbi:deoxyribonuclease IV [Salsipaludibacter albus]|uniref:deoxyribonuclease IV n=1 Tax=Salsipaludibacter albus TaxID=2849650 RepID=UPI001EE3E445|nr:deoxyribonuclease IV [Salsipaludibacter albus]
MRIGVHVPGTDPLGAAAARGADLVQVFLTAPQSYDPPPDRDDTAQLVASDLPVYVHAPYLINVATGVNRIRHPSRSNLEQTVRAAEAIDAAGVIVHGGHVSDDDDPATGYGNWRTTLDRLETTVPILVENTAGGTNAMARRVDRMLALFEALDGTDTPHGLCLDTCHLWAGGDDLVEGTRRLLDGVGRIDLVHANDSRDEADSGRDRHANLGAGQVDPEALVEVVRMADADVVLETPGDVADHVADLAWLRERL